MKKIGLLLILAFFSFFASSQDKLSLQKCLELAENNYPLINQKELIDSYEQIKLNSLNKNYLPQATLKAQATYQSDVTQIALDLPPTLPFTLDIPEMDRDSYKATIDVTQLIYDGGSTKQRKILEQKDAQINRKSLEKDLYAIKKNINQLFFGIILYKKQIRILNIAKSNLEETLKKLEAGLKHGVVLESEVNIVKVEIIKLRQRVSELHTLNQANMNMLSEYLNQAVDEKTEFELPEFVLTPTNEIERPEIDLFELNKESLLSSKDLLKCKNQPIVSAFAQVGYGKPGLNMLSNEMDDFYMVGVNLSWKLWDWKQNKQERSLLDVNSQIIETQKEAFSKNIRIANEKELGEIQKWDKMLVMDNDIIDLRTNIRKTKQSQLENGTITSTDYIVELNNETQAKLDKELHTVQYKMAVVNYMNNNGQINQIGNK